MNPTPYLTAYGVDVCTFSRRGDSASAGEAMGAVLAHSVALPAGIASRTAQSSIGGCKSTDLLGGVFSDPLGDLSAFRCDNSFLMLNGEFALSHPGSQACRLNR